MKPIKIIVTGTDACVTEKPVITSGTVGLPVEFTFDEAWNGLGKTAVFRAGSRSYPVSCVQSTAIVPWEVLEKPNMTLHIGVFGTDGDATVCIPTVWAQAGTIWQGTQIPDTVPQEPTPQVYDQILTAVSKAVETANSVREDANAGKFNIVGQKSPNGGEIFNDYKNNIAISPNAHAEGQNTLAGIKGFNTIAVDTENLLITVDDTNLEEKASTSYVVGDTLQFDASQHHYNKLKIVSLSTNDNGQSVIGIEKLVEDELDLSLDSDPNENFVWVVGKNYGEVFPMAYGAHAEGESTKAMGRAAHAEGRQTQAIGGYSHAEGMQTVANYAAHAEGQSTQATGNNSHAEGYKTVAFESHSHAEGSETNATGTASHAEGRKTKAIGNYSHAEGYETVAQGPCSHAEGQRTTASGGNSHAEGYETVAKTARAHAEGKGTIAASIDQHVQGRYNKEDNRNKYAHIVGNGTADDLRSNAHTVDWSGNAWYAGSITIGNTTITETQLQALLAIIG